MPSPSLPTWPGFRGSRCPVGLPGNCRWAYNFWANTLGKPNFLASPMPLSENWTYKSHHSPYKPNMTDKLAPIAAAFQEALSQATHTKELEAVKVRFLGKKG